MRNFLIAVAAVVLWAPAVAHAHEYQKCPETADRLAGDALTDLAAGPLQLVAGGDFEGADKALEALLLQLPPSTPENPILPDTLMGFAVGVHSEGTGDVKVQARALPYFRRALKAYREVFGEDHLEVALAWSTLGDASLALAPKQPTDEAIDALQRAYDIRVRKLGPNNIETAASAALLGNALGQPSRTRGDEGAITTAAEWFERSLSGARAMSCENDFDGRLARDYLAMLVRNDKAEVALQRFDELIDGKLNMERDILAARFMHDLARAGREDEARRIERRFPDVGPLSREPFLDFLE
jgi:tetratricopeptide (TPR) repeat protein